MNEILGIIIGVLGLALGVGAAARSGQKKHDTKNIQKATDKALESQLDVIEKVAAIDNQKEKDIEAAKDLDGAGRVKKLNEKIGTWNK